MAHAGDASQADSQMYVVLTQERTRSLDGDYTVFGQVISGMDVVRKIAQNDSIRRVTVRGETTAAKPAAPPAAKPAAPPPPKK